MTRRLLHITTFTLAAAVLMPAAAAQGAKAAPLPVVSSIDPLRLGIGDTMTITGKNFRKGANKNTVVFKRDGRPAVFAKAVSATSTQLTVVVPEKVRSSLSKQQGAFVATRFRIRVLARRFSKSYTKLAASPVIEPLASAPAAPAPALADTPAAPTATATGTGAAATAPADTPATSPTTDPAPKVDPPVTCSDTGADDDGDLLSDVLEGSLKTDRCKVDSDGDGMEDGWEYQSALDLNRESCANLPYPTPCAAVTPYPAKRAFVNPLFPDSAVDYDGDWLPAGREHAAWKKKGVRSLSSLWYSDGLQYSQDTTPGDACRGVAASIYTPLLGAAEYSIDRDGDGCLSDSERDEDNDFLTNDEEIGGEMSGSTWWNQLYEEPAFRVEYEGTDWLDQDTDGDTIVDGMDDQDHDDFWNVEEIKRGTAAITKKDVVSADDTGLWVDPFNPCLPSVNSRTCPVRVPLSGDPWRPYTSRLATENVKPRWPLYGTEIYSGELWQGKPALQQTMPPQHPLLPRPR